LIDFLKKKKREVFQWSKQKQAVIAFEQLKVVITLAPMLVLPNFDGPFEVKTDASESGIGVFISQGKYPIAFLSKKLSPAMQKKSTYTSDFYVTFDG